MKSNSQIHHITLFINDLNLASKLLLVPSDIVITRVFKLSSILFFSSVKDWLHFGINVKHYLLCPQLLKWKSHKCSSTFIFNTKAFKLFNDEQGFEIVRMRIREAQNKSRWINPPYQPERWVGKISSKMHVTHHYLFTIDSLWTRPFKGI